MAQSQNSNFITDFTTGSIPRQMLKFTTPLFLSNLLQVVYNMVDMIIVGQVEGRVGLSAISIGGDISNFPTYLAMGFSAAGQVITAQYIGSGDRKRASQFIGTTFAFLMPFALLLTAVCFLLRHPLLALMNTPAQSYCQTLSYTNVCIAGLLFIYGYNMISAVLRGLGDSKHPFLFISIATILNVLLDLLFVLKFNMGAMGAGLATVISQGISFLCCIVFLWHQREKIGIELKAELFFHINKKLLLSLLKLGIPMAIRNASIQFSKLFVNAWINSYGIAVSAMAGIANKISNITNLVSNSVNTSGASMVGQNIGAGHYKRIPSIMWASFLIATCFSLCMTAMILLFPKTIFSLFTSEAEVLALSKKYIPIAIILFISSACRVPMNTLINGSGNHIINFVTAILDGFVMRIGLSLLFGLTLNMKYLGFWLGDALAGFTPFFIGLVYYYTGIWRKPSSYKSAEGIHSS